MLYFVFAVILSIVNYFSEAYASHIEKYHTQLISFSAGLFITFIFLDLLPEFFKGLHHVGENIFFLMLLGFVVFHVSEKYIYQHVKHKKELMQDLSWLHIVGFFTDHFIIGIALFLAFQVPDVFLGMLIFIPLLLRIFSSSISLNHIDEKINMKKHWMVLLSFAPLFGTLFAFFLNPTKSLYYSIFSFIIGALLYIVIRDMLPKGERGNLLFFLFGFLVSLILFTLLGVFS